MLYLTYGLGTDGLGAQFQRVIGIMALAKKHGCKYVHSPIQSMEHIPEPMPEYLKRIEDYFQIHTKYKNVNEIKYDKIIDVQNAEIESTILLYKNSVFTILLKIIIPNGILDANTKVYNYIMPDLRQIRQKLDLPKYDKNKMNIAIHIRRGDVNQSLHPYRYTPMEYFKQIAQHLLTQFPEANICIFSEVTQENIHEFDAFHNMNVKLIMDEDVLLTLEYLIRANILVTSKSSFSYIAGLYNENTVLYTPFWHRPMPHWRILN
jgi:hypothetical protein